LPTGVDPSSILCLTLTEAGAAEVASRICRRLAYRVRPKDPDGAATKERFAAAAPRGLDRRDVQASSRSAALPVAGIDLAAAAAFAPVACLAANAVHEVVGPCGAAVGLGGGCGFVSTSDIRLTPATPLEHFPIVAVAGTVANLIAMPSAASH
jgi:hypothetical protein